MVERSRETNGELSFENVFPTRLHSANLLHCRSPFLCLEHVHHWERIASRGRPAFSSQSGNTALPENVVYSMLPIRSAVLRPTQGDTLHNRKRWQEHGILKSLVLTFVVLISGTPISTAFPFVSARSSTESVPAVEVRSCKILYAGFVGAMESSNHKGSGVVQLRDVLRGPEYPDVCSESFMPLSWETCRSWILRQFPEHSGPLTQAEIEGAPRIILVGHSTGGWAMLKVARDLRDRAIPIELTVQLDSVGITDYTVPSNVKRSAIFHASDFLMFLTTKNVRMEDPRRTKLIANILVKNASHLSITRDPRVKTLVLNTVLGVREDIARFSEDRQSETRADGF